MPLPTPPNWPLTDRRRQFVPGLVIGTLWVLGGVFLAAGEVTGPWLPAGQAAFWYGVAYLARPGRAAVGSRDGALVLRSSRRRIAVVYAATGALCLGAALEIGGVLGVATMALYAGAMVFLARRGLGGEVALDPEGVAFAVPGFHRRVPWPEVARVGMRRDGRLHVSTSAGESVWVRTDGFDEDPLVVYWTLHHYATHPESRAELADARAVERVRREDLL